jgi:DNA ligase D-like protein (predicted polymerase)
LVLRLTHPGRVYWPDAGITKAALAAYYDALANRLLPHIAGRPLALVRCPHGIAESCFFQKHAWEGMPDAVGRTTSRGQELLSIRDREGLRALAQAGALEIHVWGATLARLETPDRLVFDLDPGEGATFADVIAAALEVRERLAQSGLVSFARTTGGKGLHVVVPLAPGAGWAETKGFAAAPPVLTTGEDKSVVSITYTAPTTDAFSVEITFSNAEVAKFQKMLDEPSERTKAAAEVNQIAGKDALSFSSPVVTRAQYVMIVSPSRFVSVTPVFGDTLKPIMRSVFEQIDFAAIGAK